MAPQIIDFDAFRAEQNEEPVVILIGGRRHELPSSLPASIALDIIAMHRTIGDGAKIPPESLEKMGRGLFGDQFDVIVTENRLTMVELGELMQRVLTAYNPEAGKVPNRERRRRQRKRSGSRS